MKTKEEIASFHEAETLYKSNLFRMQMNECLSNISFRETKTKELDTFLKKLHKYLLANQTDEKICVDDGVYPKEEGFGEFEGVKPSAVHVVGSYILKTLPRPNLNVDLGVEMPKEMFGEKDHLNYRYFKKKYCFLKGIERMLSKFDENVVVSFVADKWTPFVKIETKFKYTVRLFGIIDSSVFPINKLGPMKNCVRPWLLDESVERDSASELEPTPFYNQMILKDMMMLFHLHYLSEIGINSELKNGMNLAKLWTRKQGVEMNTFIVSMIFAFLIKEKDMSVNMSSYQMFRMFLTFLGGLENRVYTICENFIVSEKVMDNFKNEMFLKFDDFVLLDPTGLFNLFGFESNGFWKTVKEKAKVSLNVLDGEDDLKCFNFLFLKQINEISYFDGIYLIQGKEEEMSVHERNELENVLRQGLKERCENIFVSGDCKIKMKFSENANKIIEIGPIADQVEEAKEFREFWGEKAELRRLADGSIRECVLFSNDPIKEIIDHILNKNEIKDLTNLSHFNLMKFPNPLKLNEKSLIVSFDELCRTLKEMKKLPLCINTIYGLSSSLRYSYHLPFMPTIEYLKKMGSHFNLENPFIPVQEAMIVFEFSGRWPEDDHAIHIMKIALLGEISKRFEKSSLNENGFLDIEKDGYIFRFFIAPPFTKLDDKPLDLEKCFNFGNFENSFYFKRIKLNDLCKNSYSKYPSAFRDTMMIVKRFCSAHFLISFNSIIKSETPKLKMLFDSTEDIIDFLVASLFSDHSVPRGQSNGFFRFLELISSLDFESLIQKTKNSDNAISFIDSNDQAMLWKRFKMICSNTLKLCINFNSPEKYSSIFTPNLSEFDCYLTLNELNCTRVAERHTKPLCKENLIHSEESSQIEFIHKKDPKGLDHLWIDFDPAAKYVASIREKFHDQVLVFHNPFGGTHIGIIFKRSLFKDTPNIQILKKPKLSFDSKQGKKVKQSLPYPVNAIGFDDDSQKWLTEPNYHGIIMDIARCGSGILQSIHKKQ